MDILEYRSVEEVAYNLYESMKDMDYLDYEDTKEETINQLIDALYWLKTTAQNELNHDYFRTLWNCLQQIN